MAGYTRQSAAAIVDDNVIYALDLNSEFNALQNAFSGLTGHTHDGTTGNGPKINLQGAVTGILPFANGGTGATTQGEAQTNLGISPFIKTLLPAVDAAAARTTLSAQTLHPALTSISGLTTAANQMIYTTALNTYATTGLTAFARTILDDADAATVKTTLGLATVATSGSAADLTGVLSNDRLSGDYSFDGLTLSGNLSANGVQNKNPNYGYRLMNGNVQNGSLYTDTTTGNPVLRKYNLTTGAGEGYIRIDGNGVDDFKYNGFTVWHTGNLVAADITALYGYTPASNAISITAGNGLSGGGTLAATRTVTLGTPTSITGSSTNSVTTTSHTHSITLSSGDIIEFLGYTPVGTTRQVVAGNGLTGGGTLAADRALTLGTPGTLTGSTGNSVSTTSHTHDVDAISVVAAGLAGMVYNGSSTTQTNYPIGTVLACSIDGRLGRNETTTVRIDPGSDWGFRNYSTGTALTGTWRGAGATSGGEGLVRRTA